VADFTQQMVERQEVRLEFDAQRKDKYSRTLAYVYVGEQMLNAELVRQGYAQVATFPPNVKYQELFLKLQIVTERASGRIICDISKRAEAEAGVELEVTVKL
jgi:endonuclease YncB( thermonuclease family)